MFKFAIESYDKKGYNCNSTNKYQTLYKELCLLSAENIFNLRINCLCGGDYKNKVYWLPPYDNWIARVEPLATTKVIYCIRWFSFRKYSLVKFVLIGIVIKEFL